MGQPGDNMQVPGHHCKKYQHQRRPRSSLTPTPVPCGESYHQQGKWQGMFTDGKRGSDSDQRAFPFSLLRPVQREDA